MAKETDSIRQEFDHCFVVCAYKESPYIGACIESLKGQGVPARVVVSTSTPNGRLAALCEKQGVPLFIREGQSGLAADWNFALKAAPADFVTIAHQDDIYHRDYLEKMREYAWRAKNPILLFTDYAELRGGVAVEDNRLLRVKRKINAVLKRPAFWGSRFVRRRSLAVGNAICCPSVCIHKARFPDFAFDASFICALDWDAWSRLADEQGEFIYIPEILMCHRIHEESETTRLIANGARFSEDLAILSRYWPGPVARFIMGRYKASAKSNEGTL